MTVDLKNDRIVWIDVESDGLNPFGGCKLLQVAAIVTNGDLQPVRVAPFSAKIYHSADEVERMRRKTVPFVRAMHDATNLWNTLPSEGQPLEKVEESLLSYLKNSGVEDGKARLGGNSITLDRNFLLAYMPKVLNFLSYRSYDMTSVGGFFELFAPEVKQFEKKKSHDALDDIRESIEEARYYRKIFEAGQRRLKPFLAEDI